MQDNNPGSDRMPGDCDETVPDLRVQLMHVEQDERGGWHPTLSSLALSDFLAQRERMALDEMARKAWHERLLALSLRWCDYRSLPYGLRVKVEAELALLPSSPLGHPRRSVALAGMAADLMSALENAGV